MNMSKNNYHFSTEYVKLLHQKLGQLSMQNDSLLDSQNKRNQWLSKAKATVNRDALESFDDVFNDMSITYLLHTNQQWPTVKLNEFGSVYTVRPLMTIDKCHIKQHKTYNSLFCIDLNTSISIHDIVAINFDYNCMHNLLNYPSINTLINKLLLV